VHSDPPVFPGRLDPSDRFRDRRRRARRRRRTRQLAVFGCVVGGIVALTLNATLFGGDERRQADTRPGAPPPATTADDASRLPAEIRGIHVTAPLASIPGKLEEYVALETAGLNTVQLDVKDENGEVGFVRPAVPLARQVGAAQRYYDARAAARLVHDAGLYLIGRVVVFQDPRLSVARPELALRTPSGDVWTTTAGLGWTNPYDKRVWKYNVDIAEAAAKAGFDEIMFDYVRFPTDGTAPQDYGGLDTMPKSQAIEEFVQYARERLDPYGVRVSAALFGLAATRDLGIGQRPRLLANHLDAIYPMVYPSHFGSGEYDLPDPGATPGRTVSFALIDYRRKLAGRDADLIPWLQDFGGYALDDIAAQIDAAERAQARGFMLWNADGIYTDGAVAP
jgi:hypothetical protein